MLQLMLCTLLGIAAGICTGISPGIHINLIAAMVIANASLMSKFSPASVGCFIVAMSVTHTFLDFIPSVFLGAPNDDTAVAVLPAHKLMKLGLGYEAVMISCVASFIGLIIMVLLFTLSIILIPLLYEKIQPFVAVILIGVLLMLIIREQRKLWAILSVILCGALGLIIFEIPIRDVLFPLFSGLFGISGLLLSIGERSRIPFQKFSFPKFFRSDKGIFARSSVASLLTGMLPGMGSAQAAMVASLGRTLREREYILLVGASNTMVMLISFGAWMSIEKARNGSVVALMRLFPSASLNLIILFLCVCLITGSVCVLITPRITRLFLKFLTKFNYAKVVKIVIVIISILVVVISGWIGLVITLVSCVIGITCSLSIQQKSLMMACLIVPVILFFV